MYFQLNFIPLYRLDPCMCELEEMPVSRWVSVLSLINSNCFRTLLLCLMIEFILGNGVEPRSLIIV